MQNQFIWYRVKNVKPMAENYGQFHRRFGVKIGKTYLQLCALYILYDENTIQ